MIRGFLTAATTSIATVALASTSLAQERQLEAAILPGIPTSALPPEGMCRVWLKAVPVGRQPAATDCVAAIKLRPRDAILLIGDQVKQARGSVRSPVNSMMRGRSNDELFGRNRPQSWISVRQAPVASPATVKALEVKATVKRPPQ